jgi:fructan beta-fructosidase
VSTNDSVVHDEATPWWRPQCHFSAQRNWINDPNGLIWWGGQYHLFFQYNPFGDPWGHMSWGHAVSRDLLHWDELPVAIPEDERASIFSGSVVADWHNLAGFAPDGYDPLTPPLVAIYTGCLRRSEGGQAQELAYSLDGGLTWAKHAGNPVLDLGLRDFRDPKVFWHSDTHRWVMAVVLPDARQVVFYGSLDLRSWTELSRFSDDLPGQGIWECPDLLALAVDDGSTAWLLKVDVFEGHPSLGSGARIVLGNFDGTRFTADALQACPWADHGADFYAALSWANLPDSPQRNVWVGWMNCHRYAKLLPTHPWRGAMSVPREISLHRDALGALHLRQTPVREIANLRGAHFEASAMLVSQGVKAVLPTAFDARAMDMQFTLEAGDSDRCGVLLRVGSGTSAGVETRVGIDRGRGTVFVDRSRSGFTPDDPHYATRREVANVDVWLGNPVRLRILLDWSSVEVFIGDGQAVITEQILPPADARGVRLFAEGGTARFTGVKAFELKAR